METGMTNLGSGGEAKASPADREAADTDLQQSDATGGVPGAAGRGGSMDAALGANDDANLPPDDITLEQGRSAPLPTQVGAGETAAYGETVEDMPALDSDDEG
jgi:hypothetical protein